MKTIKLTLPAFIIVIFTAFYLLGVDGVPFHPDESTQLFMSQDIETWFSRPSQLFWQPENESDPVQKYHELDAPLTRYLAGIGRKIAGFQALPVDWDWSKSWAENEAAGALPSKAMLAASRLALALLFPFSLLFVFLSGKILAGEPGGWMALLLTAGNALVLLHTRRVMAEGVLLFSTCFLIWWALRRKGPAWLIALPVALCFCAKQSTGLFVPLGLLLVWFWQPQSTIRTRLQNAAFYLLLLGTIVWLLNPFLWAHPLEAAQFATQARQQLLDNQVAAIGAQRQDQIMNTLPKRAVSILANLFFTQPAIADVGNYLKQTQSAQAAYFSSPLTHLLRDLAGGGILLGLTLMGSLTAAIQWIFPKRRNTIQAWPVGALLAISFLQVIFLLLWVPLTFQRYVLPLVPMTNLWISYGLVNIIKKTSQVLKTREVSKAK